MFHKSIILSLLVCFLLSFKTNAQLRDGLGGLTSRPYYQKAVPSVKKKAAAVRQLPFEDDFSYRETSPADSLWLDDNVFVNTSFGINPRTLGVASFDGLTFEGRAYDLNSTNIDTLDYLTSQTIDLSNPTDSVYLTFVYQRGGRGEIPNIGDSLTVEFFSPSANQWNQVWGANGTDNRSAFKFGQVAVHNIYFQDDFQFRFVNYGNPSGAYDMWHIDLVRLDDERNFNDTLFTDRAFTEVHPPLFTDYESIPWFHYTQVFNNDQRIDFPTFSFRENLIDPTDTSLDLTLGEYSVRLDDGSIVAENLVGRVEYDDGRLPNTRYNFSLNNFVYQDPAPQLSAVDEFEIRASCTWSPDAEGHNLNDTVYKTHAFKNYYAYDDGSAERAYFLENPPSGGAYTLSKYFVWGTDNIRGLYVYFLPSGTDISQNDFKIAIFDDAGGQPGNLIYESDSNYLPRFTVNDFYLPYQLDIDTLELLQDETYYIGVKQRTVQRLNIGFDVNRVGKTDLIFGYENDWTQSFRQGTIMMRPYFRYTPRDFSISEPALQKAPISIYPNPAQDLLYFSQGGDPNLTYTYEVISLSGSLMMSGSTSEPAIVSPLKPGVYLVRIKGEHGYLPKVEKLLIPR